MKYINICPVNLQAEKRSISRPVFDDVVPVTVVDEQGECAEERLNMSGDSAISSASAVSCTIEPPADIVSLHRFALDLTFVIVTLIRNGEGTVGRAKHSEVLFSLL